MGLSLLDRRSRWNRLGGGCYRCASEGVLDVVDDGVILERVPDRLQFVLVDDRLTVARGSDGGSQRGEELYVAGARIAHAECRVRDELRVEPGIDVYVRSEILDNAWIFFGFDRVSAEMISLISPLTNAC